MMGPHKDLRGSSITVGPTVDSEEGGPTGGGKAPAQQYRVLLLWALAFLAFRVLFVRLDGLPPSLALPVGVAVFMLLSLLGPRYAAPLRLPPVVSLLGFMLFGALSLGIAAWWGGPPPRPLPVPLAAVADLCLILAAIALGHLLLRLFREPNLLVPAAVAAAVIDYAMVYSPSGTTRALLEQHAEVVDKLSVAVPVPGMPDLQLGVGFGDFVFLSLFLAAAVRFDLRERRTFWVCTAFLVVAMALVALTGVPVPALVPMAIAFVVANAGRIRFAREEVRAMGVVALVIAAAAVLALVARTLRH